GPDDRRGAQAIAEAGQDVSELAEKPPLVLLDLPRLKRERPLLPGQLLQGIHRISIPATRAAATSIKPHAANATPSAGQSLEDAGRGGLIRRRRPPAGA